MSDRSAQPASAGRPALRHPFRRKNFRLRLLPLYGVAAAAFWLAVPTPGSLVLGGVVLGLGEGLRLWATGHLVKTRSLTATGPYAYLRHPLYLGTLLLGLGFGLAGGRATALLVAGLFVPVFAFYYIPYKERVETERLLARYGEPYAEYHRAVPALWPRSTPWRPAGSRPADGSWSFERVKENDELGALLGVTLGVAALWFRAQLG